MLAPFKKGQDECFPNSLQERFTLRRAERAVYLDGMLPVFWYTVNDKAGKRCVPGWDAASVLVYSV
jgi:hypothetical protein